MPIFCEIFQLSRGKNLSLQILEGGPDELKLTGVGQEGEIHRMGARIGRPGDEQEVLLRIEELHLPLRLDLVERRENLDRGGMLFGRYLFAEHRPVGELPRAMEEGQALGERLMGARFVDDG
ncbi:MAG: hypothetical protein EBU04_05860 [Verrucomicrobia bacterium]|nr:hypothetical protein [Verrucomicrobiota bacterium]